jgi:predicted nucleic acid-binding protein
MANVFLDANALITIIEQRPGLLLKNLDGYTLLYSPLSIHIWAYLYKSKMPQEALINFLNGLTSVNLDESITNLALLGPTKDFEDNVQLHSAKKSDCEFFLTFDKDLLKMKKFASVKIVNNL